MPASSSEGASSSIKRPRYRTNSLLRECFFGNTLHNALSASQSDCGQSCAGNSGEVCGGGNRIQVYKDTTWRVPPDADVADSFQALSDALAQAKADIQDYLAAVQALDKIQSQGPSKRRRWPLRKRQTLTETQARANVANSRVAQPDFPGYVGKNAIDSATYSDCLYCLSL